MKNIQVVKEYHNLKENRKIIMAENRGQAGVYMWENLKNDKSYIGSSRDLKVRFEAYFCPGVGSRNTPICKALNKYGLEGFKLSILVYCKKEDVLILEQKYLDKLKPTYNILKTAGSPAGRKVSDETKKLISIKLKQHWKDKGFHLGKAVRVVDVQTNLETIYTSLREMERELHIGHATILKYIENGKVYKNKRFVWHFTTLP
jgi:excinuclease UvrABC nuclease subunit